MRRSVTVVSIVTAGVAALALAAGPVLAQPGPNTVGPGSGAGSCPMATDADDQGSFGSQGYGRGGGGMMNGTGGGMMNGTGGMRRSLANVAPMGTLTTAQQSTLASMAEEEKLAHDVYVALAARFPTDYQFAHIANAETMHQSALRALLARYGIADPTANLATGHFSTSAFQTMYDDLTARATTAQNALAVGIAVEELDIADLTAALSGLSAPDVAQVYTNLRNASQHHLAAFGG